MGNKCVSELRKGKLGKERRKEKTALRQKHIPYYHIYVFMINVCKYLCIYVNKNKGDIKLK